MPRRAASLPAVPAYTPTPPFLKPPPNLSETAKAVFDELVTTSDVDHFMPSDAHLLGQYAEAIVLAERACAQLHQGANNQALVVWEKATRTMTALSMRLRLSPQARREKAQVPKTLSWSERAGLERQASERLR